MKMAAADNPTSMNPEAKRALDDLAAWFGTAQTEYYRPNLTVYAGSDRIDRIKPLLIKLGLYEKV